VRKNWLEEQWIRIRLAVDSAALTHSAYTRADFSRTMLDDYAYLTPREDIVVRIEQNSHFMRSPKLRRKR
jgi:hypothetical protein